VIPLTCQHPPFRTNKATRFVAKTVTDAIETDRLKLYYQPVVRADSHDFIAFNEALVRIESIQGRIIPAAVFMPSVENTPTGRLLDRIMLRKSLRALQSDPCLRLSVNVSVSTMKDREWREILHRHVCGTGHRLVIEVTEGAAMRDIAASIAFFDDVRSLGCSVALDDFGAGSTSFRYFRDFRFDILKIDGLFIRDLPKNRDNQVLVKALIDIGKHFDMLTVAEFIETRAEADLAASMGVDCLQGYFVGKPDRKPVSGVISPHTHMRAANAMRVQA